jgi:DASS family divalent anion:Na+ symporter
MRTPPSAPRWPRLIPSLGVGAAIWVAPAPDGLAVEAWRTFAVFAAVICGFIFRPIEMAPTVLLGLVVLVLTGTLPLSEAIRNGFGDTTVWLVVTAFLIAGAVERTGLGRRLALVLVRALGRSLLGIAYAIAAVELCLAPFVPSNTARGGGIISPVVRSLAEALGSRPGDESRQNGAFLCQVGGHTNLVSSAMLLTAMAGNQLIVAPAREHLGVQWDFGTWLLGSIAPGLAAMALLPLVVSRLEPPVAGDLAGLRARVLADLAELGPWSRREVTLGIILLALLGLWSMSRLLGLHPTTIALAGILALVLTGTQSWREMAATAQAWDALIWLGGFVALAEALKSSGFVDWFGGQVGMHTGSWDPVTFTIVLGLIYFASMYLFSQLTAHIAALAGLFLLLARDAGAPPLLALAIISYFSCLCGATTPWSTGPVIIYFGFGYVSVGRWMRNGFFIALFQIAVWLAVGLVWWRILGWW